MISICPMLHKGILLQYGLVQYSSSEHVQFCDRFNEKGSNHFEGNVRENVSSYPHKQRPHFWWLKNGAGCLPCSQAVDWLASCCKASTKVSKLATTSWPPWCKSYILRTPTWAKSTTPGGGGRLPKELGYNMPHRLSDQAEHSCGKCST